MSSEGSGKNDGKLLKSIFSILARLILLKLTRSNEVLSQNQNRSMTIWPLEKLEGMIIASEEISRLCFLSVILNSNFQSKVYYFVTDFTFRISCSSVECEGWRIRKNCERICWKSHVPSRNYAHCWKTVRDCDVADYPWSDYRWLQPHWRRGIDWALTELSIFKKLPN